MISTRLLRDTFSQTYGSIKELTAGLTHEDSLIQPPFPGNCFNWVLGHIVVARTNVLYPLGERSTWDRDRLMRYVPGSPPITGDDRAIRLEAILAELDRTQGQIVAALGRATPESLAAPVGDGDKTLGMEIHGYAIHEAGHVGQLELLRRLAGA
jgi:hypothetical protein